MMASNLDDLIADVIEFLLGGDDDESGDDDVIPMRHPTDQAPNSFGVVPIVEPDCSTAL